MGEGVLEGVEDRVAIREGYQLAEASDEGVEVALLLHGEDVRVLSYLDRQWNVHNVPFL